MASQNVDDLLISQMTGTEPPPKVEDVPRETVEETKGEDSTPKTEARVNPELNDYGDKSQEAKVEAKTPEPEPQDEYGLEAESAQEAQKTYSKSEMDAYANQIVRERLARLERNSGQQATPQQVQQQVQQAQQGFNYDENSNLDWQQQLEQFVFQAADKREQYKAQQAQQMKEHMLQAEFETRFRSGMSKFNDYIDVVGGRNITDEMVKGARGIKDPAAFFYAAAKRAPDELAKIANEPDPYAQAAAIGRLDERLRKQATKLSNTPRPVHKTQADMGIEHKQPEKKKQNLDDMLIEDEKNKIALLAQRRR